MPIFAAMAVARWRVAFCAMSMSDSDTCAPGQIRSAALKDCATWLRYLAALKGCATALLRTILHELPAEAAFDAQVTAGDVVICGRGDFDDGVVLHVEC